MKTALFTLLLFVLALAASGQQSDSQLAFRYYNNKEYGKAAELFLQLYERTRSSQYLDYHVISLINNKDYEKAEETMKNFLKTSNNTDFLLNLGYIYEQQGKIKQKNEYFNRALKGLRASNNDILSMASKFRSLREYEWANKTYLKGRELLKRPTAFMMEMGDNYLFARNFDAMLEQYIEYLKINPGNVNTITSKLSTARASDVNNSIDSIIWGHLHKVFGTSDYPAAFDEIAVWLSLQTEDFPNAFNYAVKLNTKAINKLNVYLDIAREAGRKKEFAVALEAYQRILNAGKENNGYYIPAQKEILLTKYASYESERRQDTSYSSIALKGEEYLKEHGFTDQNTDIILLLSDIYAYKLQLLDTASNLLERGINIRRISPANSNKLKSKRADILAFNDNPWEATILYTQIEKANPNNDIGFEAKLKKAWMAYYVGDLLWANAQFSVLKGSTTKLIANDALKMSHFIGMNYDPQGENDDLIRIAHTEYLIFKKRTEEAHLALDSVISHTGLPAIRDYARLLKAGVLILENQPEKAKILLQTLQKESEEVFIQAESIYRLAELEKESKEYQHALELYKELITNYSGSVYSIDAARLYREISQ